HRIDGLPQEHGIIFPASMRALTTASLVVCTAGFLATGTPSTGLPAPGAPPAAGPVAGGSLTGGSRAVSPAKPAAETVPDAVAAALGAIVRVRVHEVVKVPVFRGGRF